jgi:hypothetical protein
MPAGPDPVRFLAALAAGILVLAVASVATGWILGGLIG